MNRLHQNQNQKGRSCRGMKRSSRKLLGLLIAGLLLGGFAAPAYAADQAEDPVPDIHFHGYAGVSGDPDLKTDTTPTGASNPLIPEGDIHGIDVTLNNNPTYSDPDSDEGYWSSQDTTSALTFNGEKTYTIDGKVDVVNTVMHDQIKNNDAIYATGGATVTIGDKNSEKLIYLASIAKKEATLSFEDAIEQAVKEGIADMNEPGTDMTTAIQKAMNSVKNGSSVLAAKGRGGNNTINVSGQNVKLIGNLDFIGTDSGENNTINVELYSSKSFWYGDESNLEIPIIISAFDPTDIGSLLFNGVVSKLVNEKLTEKGIKKGTLNVKLANGAEWIYNANPSITALTLDHGIVNLQDEDIKSKYASTYIPDADGQTISDANGESYQLAGYRSEKPHTYVDIGTLKGSGIFKADIDWSAESAKNPQSVSKLPGDMGSDYIFITESGPIDESDTTPIIQTLSFDESKAHLEDMKADNKLYFATVSDGKTQFQTEHSVYSNAANVFNYDYKAADEKSPSYVNPDSRDWFIKVTGKTAEDNANFTAARALMDAGYAMGTELDTLNKRMGEARYLDDDQGLWVRYRHGRSSRDNSYETDSNMIQLGYDRKNDAESGTHHRGVAFDYTDADTSLYQLSGSGDVDRYALSLYDTWMGNKGHYYDFVIRGGRINNGYDISGRFSTGMESMDNSYHQWFGSVSFEYGRKKDMSGSWYIEPQAQLQLARIGGASFTSASGVRTELDGTTSLIGRAGFRLGREFGSEGNDRNTFYIKADILHEFAGDRGFTLTGNDGWYAQNDNGTDTWYDVGIGVDLSLGHSTYFWTDVERILGSDFDNTWQVSGGLRWKW